MHASQSSGAHLKTQRLYFIAEATEFSNHSCRATSLRFLAHGRPSFLVTDPVRSGNSNAVCWALGNVGNVRVTFLHPLS